jgi:hypothetical protein
MAKRTVVVAPAPPAPRPAPPLLAPAHIARDASGHVVEYERGGALPAPPGDVHAVTAVQVLAQDFATADELLAEYHRQMQAMATAAQAEINEAQRAGVARVAPAARARAERVATAIKLRDTTARQLEREEREALARAQREIRAVYTGRRATVAAAFAIERDAAYADERLVLTGAESGLRDVLATVQRRLTDEQGKLEAWMRAETARIKIRDKQAAEPPLVEAPLAEPAAD